MRRLLLPLVAVLALLPAGTADAAWTVMGSGASSAAAAALLAPGPLTAQQSCTPVTATTISHIGATTAIGTGSVMVTTPTGVRASDALVLQLTIRDQSATVTLPDEWTPLDVRSTSGLQGRLYLRRATANEPASRTITLSSSVKTVTMLSAYRGVHPGTAAVNASGGLVVNSTSVPAPILTTTRTNTRMVSFFGFMGSGGITAPAEMTSRAGGTTAGTLGFESTNVSAVAADELIAAAGDTPPRTAQGKTNGGFASSYWGVAQTVVLRPESYPQAELAWTPTTTTWASGYTLRRFVNGTEQGATEITPASTSSARETPLSADTTYTFDLRTRRNNWRSAAVTAQLTTSPC